MQYKIAIPSLDLKSVYLVILLNSANNIPMGYMDGQTSMSYLRKYSRYVLALFASVRKRGG
jgi:hypothetical protein